jgi:hypothetical protein
MGQNTRGPGGRGLGLFRTACAQQMNSKVKSTCQRAWGGEVDAWAPVEPRRVIGGGRRVAQPSGPY